MILRSIYEGEKRLFSVSELCAYVGLGRCSAVEFARQCGAVVRIGKRCLYDKRIIDRALDGIREPAEAAAL